MVLEVPLLEHSPDNTKSDQAEQLETSQQVTDAHKEMTTKFEHDNMGRNPVLADLISSCPRTRCEKRQEEMLPAKQSPRRCHQHLRPTAGQRRRHVPNRRIEDKLSARQAPNTNTLMFTLGTNQGIGRDENIAAVLNGEMNEVVGMIEANLGDIIDTS